MVRIRSVASLVWKWYSGMLDSRPLVTQSVTTGNDYVLGAAVARYASTPTGLVCGLGDAIAQVFIEKKELVKYDLHRTARMTAIGLVFTVREFDVFWQIATLFSFLLANTSI